MNLKFLRPQFKDRHYTLNGLRLFIVVTAVFSCVAFAGIWKFALESGTIGHNWDWSILPLADQLKYTSQQSFQVWRGTFGNPASSQLNYSVLTYFIGFFGYLGLAGDFVSKFYLFLIILISGVSMFYLVRSIITGEKKSPLTFTTFFSASMAGYFYALSPFLFSEFIGGALTQFLAYALLPVSVFLCRKMNYYDDFKYIFAFTVVLSLISVSFNALPLALIIVGLYAIFLWNKQLIKKLAFSLAIFIPFNLYWIIPTLSEMAHGTSSLALALPNALYLPNLFNAVPSMSQIFAGLGYARPFSLWVLQETILPIWVFLTFSFLICIIVSLLLFRKNRESFFWIASYTSSLAIATVGNSPISGLMLWLYENIPFMSLYRSPQHLIILTILPLAILVGLGSGALVSFSRKRLHIIRHKKIFTLSVFLLIFLCVTIWISPFLTGNLGADYLRSRGGGNFVDTFNFSPDLIAALGIINNGSADSYRTLFLPPTNSPYYLETPYQQEGQGVDAAIGSTPQGIGDSGNEYTSPLISAIGGSFENGSFNDPLLLQVANIKYIMLRNDVIPNFGPYAAQWNSTKVTSILMSIDGLRLIYSGPYVSLWEYENPYPLVYTADNSSTILGSKLMMPNSSEQINFVKVDSSTYHVTVTNQTSPFYLVFSQTYDTSWQLYQGSITWVDTLNNEPISATHLLVNTYANAWLINQTGTFTLTIHYSPQNMFYLSSIISAFTLSLCFAILIYKYATSMVVEKFRFKKGAA